MTEQLAWGASYVAVRPDHFRVDYQINPFMDPSVQPDPELAMKQWQSLVDTIEGLGGTVHVLDQRPDAPDMAYAMNLGLAVERGDGSRHVVLSHMRFPERRMETVTARDFFEAKGWTTSYVGRDGVGAHFEAGDAFAFQGDPAAAPRQADAHAIGELVQVFVQRPAQVGQVGVIALEVDDGGQGAAGAASRCHA